MFAQYLICSAYDRPVGRHCLRCPLFLAPLLDPDRSRKEAELLPQPVLDVSFVREMQFVLRITGGCEQDKRWWSNPCLSNIQHSSRTPRPGCRPRLLQRFLVKLIELPGGYSLGTRGVGLAGQLQQLSNSVTGLCRNEHDRRIISELDHPAYPLLVLLGRLLGPLDSVPFVDGYDQADSRFMRVTGNIRIQRCGTLHGIDQ